MSKEDDRGESDAATDLVKDALEMPVDESKRIVIPGKAKLSKKHLELLERFRRILRGL